MKMKKEGRMKTEVERKIGVGRGGWEEEEEEPVER